MYILTIPSDILNTTKIRLISAEPKMPGQSHPSFASKHLSLYESFDTLWNYST